MSLDPSNSSNLEQLALKGLTMFETICPPSFRPSFIGLFDYFAAYADESETICTARQS